MRVYLLALACTAVLAAVQATNELRGILMTRSLAAQLDATNQRGDDVEHELAALRAAVVGHASEKSSLQILARIEQASAVETSDGARQVKLLCAALSTYGSLVRVEPTNGAYLINWANIRQILSAFECREQLTNGNVAEVVALARKSDPTSVAVAFAAAQLALWSGKRPEALVLFHTALDLGTGASGQMERYMLRAVRAPQDLLAVVPMRFPHALRWSSLLLEGHPERALEYRQALAQLQQGAIARAIEDLRANQISLEIVQNWLLALLDLAADSPTRQLIDRTLVQEASDRSADQRAFRDYLRDRSQYATLASVVGLRLNDSQPQLGALAAWGRRGALSFDQNFTSVGAFVGDKQSIRFVQLQGFKLGSRLDPSELHVRVSADNQSWRDPEIEPIVRKFDGPTRELVVFEFQGLETRYLKVTFERPLRRAQFSAPLALMFTTYGNSLREGY